MLRVLYRALGYDEWLIEQVLEGPLKETKAPPLGTPRRLMETLGTDWGRELVHKDLWVRAADRTIQRHLVGGRSVVVDDVRMSNEAVGLIRRGGVIVRLSNPSVPVVRTIYEARLDGWFFDHEITNDGTLEQLRAKAHSLVREVQGL